MVLWIVKNEILGHELFRRVGVTQHSGYGAGNPDSGEKHWSCRRMVHLLGVPEKSCYDERTMNETEVKSFLVRNDYFVRDTEAAKGDVTSMSQPGLDLDDWHPIDVPGDVNAVLVRDGRIPDPHIGDNGRRCYWVTSKDWWYRIEFEFTGDGGGAGAGKAIDGNDRTGQELDVVRRYELVLDGVDGHAEVFLNSMYIGRARNAFHPHRFDVDTALTRSGKNVLLIRFEALDSVLGTERLDELAGWKNRRALIRKPQFSFGWDWALPLPSIGIAGDVRIEYHHGARILSSSVHPHMSGRVDFEILTSPEAAARNCCHIEVRVRGEGQDERLCLERAGRRRLYGSLLIPNPKAWWPNGLGEQPLYSYEISLVSGDKLVDSKSGRFGFRTVEIEEFPFTEDAGPGIAFWIRVNGFRVFCKGGNWIPLELWPATASDESYQYYIDKAANAGFTMLRVWGGGIYERELFYDLCDELGILVWQDFMFASTGYPVESLRERIITEAEYQIERLRSHPCIAMWCGVNEDVFSWALPDEYAPRRQRPVSNQSSSVGSETFGADVKTGKGDRRYETNRGDDGVYSESDGTLSVNRLHDDPEIYSMILRGLVDKNGLGVPYVESSPQSRDDVGNDPMSGNSHLSSWKFALFQRPEHPEKFREHFEQVQSFDSEFCIQGPCSMQTFRLFMPEEHLWPPDDIWTYHIQRGHARLPHHEQTLRIAGGIFGQIDDLKTYIKHGQATHVEMMRSEIESARCDRPNNGGTMMWMFNDCRPTSNWSIIDYYRNPKPAWFAAKRACASYLPIVFERSGNIGFHVSNDTLGACETMVRYGAERLDGTIAWERSGTYSLPAMSTIKIDTVDSSGWAGDAKEPQESIQNGDYLFMRVSVGGFHLPTVTYFPDGWLNVAWPEPVVTLSDIRSRPVSSDGSYEREKNERWLTTVCVTADAYVRMLHLISRADDTEFSDNYFDLPARESRTVEIVSPYPISSEQIKTHHWLTQWN